MGGLARKKQIILFARLKHSPAPRANMKLVPVIEHTCHQHTCHQPATQTLTPQKWFLVFIFHFANTPSAGAGGGDGSLPH